MVWCYKMALYQKRKEPVIDNIDGEYYGYEVVIGNFLNNIEIPITESEFLSYKQIFKPLENWIKKSTIKQ